MISHSLLLLSSFIGTFLLLKTVLHSQRLAGPVIITVISLASFAVLPDAGFLRLGLLLGAALTLIIGALDERYDLSPAAQLLGQALIVVVLVSSGWTILYVSNPTGPGLIYLSPLLGALLAALWLIFLMNAINWLDGSDGLASSVGAVAFTILATISLLAATLDSHTLNLALIGFGSITAFLIWNWPPAKVYLGTSGSWWLGLYLGLVAIAGRGKIATSVLILALPLLDAGYVIVRRLLAGQSPWRGDTVRHFHHRLQAKGLSPPVICLLAAGLSIMFGMGAVLLQTRQHPCPDFNQATLSVADQIISVGIANTPAAQSRGLSGCRQVPAGHGLYFPFAAKKQPAFWMKDMLIPIDIIWIADGAVVGIERNIPPPVDSNQPDLPLYTPPKPIDAVLELSASAAKQFDINIGSRIELND